MSPKKQVLIVSAIFGIIGLSVSVIIIAVGGGFTAGGPSITNPPSKEDLWILGENINEGTTVSYELDSLGGRTILTNATMYLNFSKDMGNSWQVNYGIENSTDSFEGDIVLSDKLTREGQLNEDARKFFQPIEQSVLTIRDLAREPKYLVIGAQWDTVNVGIRTIPVRITEIDQLSLPFRNVESFVLSFEIGNNTSKIWLAHDFPLPLKSTVYDANGKLLYQYQMIDFER